MSMISEQIEELRLMAEMFGNGEPYGNLLRRAADTIEMLFEKVREPKRGEWIDDDFVGQYRCSECDYYAIDEYDYCPNCGADMRERESE